MPTTGLVRIVLIDSLFSGRIVPIDIDGHTALVGPNGSGKTSLLRLVPIFYGELPSRIIQADGNNKSFVQHYLPNTTSYIVYEYRRRGQTCMVVLHASNDDRVVYRFIEGGFDPALFIKNDDALVEYPDLLRHIERQQRYCSRIEDVSSTSVYAEILQGRPGTSRQQAALAANFGLHAPAGRLSHIEKIVTAMFRRITTFRDIKRIIVASLPSRWDSSIALNLQKTQIGNWIAEQRAVLMVEQQRPLLEQMHQHRRLFLQQQSTLGEVRSALLRLRHQTQHSLESHAEQIKAGEHEKRQQELRFNQELDQLAQESGQLQGRLAIWQDQLSRLQAQRLQWQEQGIEDKAREVARLPQLRQEQQSLHERQQALLGEHQQLQQRYNELIAKHEKDLTAQLHELEQSKTQLLDQRNKTCGDLRAQMQAQIERLQQETQASLAPLRQELEGLQKESGRLEQATRFVFDEESDQQELRNATQLVDTCKDGVRTVERELAALQLRQSCLSAEKDRLLRQMEDLQKQIASARQQLESLQQAQQAQACSLLGFLRQHRPQWRADIGKVIRRDLLLRQDLEPALSPEDSSSLFGISLDLSRITDAALPDERQIEQDIQAALQRLEALGRQQQEKQRQLQDKAEEETRLHRQIQQKKDDQHKAEYELRQAQQRLDALKRQLERKRQQAREKAQRALQEVRARIEQVRASETALLQQQQQQREQLQRHFDGQIRQHEQHCAQACAQCDQQKEAARQSFARLKEQMQQELQRAFSERGLDAATLHKLQVQLEQIEQHIVRVQQVQEDVARWQQWIQDFQVQEPQLQRQIQDAQVQLQQLHQAIEQLRQQSAQKLQTMQEQIDRLRQEHERAQKMLQGIEERLQRLSDVAPQPSPLMDGQDLAALAQMMDEALKTRQDCLLKARQCEHAIMRAFERFEASTPAQYLAQARAELQRTQQEIEPWAWLEVFDAWYQQRAHEVRRVLDGARQNFTAQVYGYCNQIETFARQIEAFARDLRESMQALRAFRGLRSIDVRIGIDWSGIVGWPELQRIAAMYDEDADCYDELIALLQKLLELIETRRNEVRIEDLVRMDITIEDLSLNRKTARDERQLRDLSSNGLSYLVLCMILVGMLNRLRGQQDVWLTWALDELRDLDLENVTALLQMLSDNRIHLITAFPDPDPLILDQMRHSYLLQPPDVLARLNTEIDEQEVVDG